ncbi:hypothetical protein NC997_10235 [Trichocoleus sp. DQ-A2]|uniref:hypothetical protein n=1 Tax=Trichocoleus sp. DQ-A2 TaxID=2933924 RepID=UPI0016898CE6|nr:hypothetical protein [Coleofasciculus sp. FACHB-T130]MBD2084448.1 hypothetical protein [Coleofasciculus sp. FACHB-542]
MTPVKGFFFLVTIPGMRSALTSLRNVSNFYFLSNFYQAVFVEHLYTLAIAITAIAQSFYCLALLTRFCLYFLK